MTKAQLLSAALGDDGQNFETESGATLQDLAEIMGAETEYSRRVIELLDEELGAAYNELILCTRSEHSGDDPVRYSFDDGSAIVVAGNGWDVEGSVPFSWAGEEVG